MAPPWVFVLDLDGTVVGDVAAYACEHALLVAHGARLDGFKRALVDAMDDGLVRPGFGRLLDALARADARLFVYTASEGAWARVLVGCIARRYGVRVEHVFCRASCAKDRDTFELRKSVARIYPRVRKILAREGVVLGGDASAHVVVVDDSPDAYPPSEAAMVVRAPPYAGRPTPHDVTRFLAPATLRRRFGDVADALEACGVVAARPSTTSYAEFLRSYHAALANEAYAVERRGRADDRWMADLAHLVRTTAAASDARPAALVVRAAALRRLP